MAITTVVSLLFIAGKKANFAVERKRTEMSRIILNRLDYLRIQKHIREAMSARTITATEAEKLTRELNDATIVEPEEVPKDVVTMNSVVRISFPDQKKQVQFKLVYPDQANVKENKISIFSPIATALIGYRQGDIVEWIVPSGLTRIRIDELIYQPEAAGDFEL